ncbi:MAG: hypothetical protein HY718_06730 [Planctomycetes bacterium]|nr:hypothetical protein [Planctomycetota bacterium]
MTWTHERRMIVYSRLVMEFGPYSNWKFSQRPEEDPTRYNQVLQELSDYLRGITGEDGEPTAVSA